MATHVAPNLTYTITYRGEPVALSSTMRASFAAGYNQVNVIFRTDISLSKYYCYVTKADEEYGLGIGKCAYYLMGSIAANVNHAYNIEVSAENFTRGDTTYRISMYAQNAVDLTWDATYFLFTASGDQVVDKDGNILEVPVVGNDYPSLHQDTASSISVQAQNLAAKIGQSLEVY